MKGSFPIENPIDSTIDDNLEADIKEANKDDLAGLIIWPEIRPYLSNKVLSICVLF